MARIRTIKPEFWEDEVVGSLSLGARLLFIAAWNYADDEGLIRWSPAHLKSVAFRYDNNVHADTVEAWMREIEEAALAFVYSTARDRNPIAFIVNFRRHQRIDKPQSPKLAVPNWRDPAVVEVFARRDGWTCPVCRDLLEDSAFARDDSGTVPGVVAEKVKLLTDQNDAPSNIRIVHAACSRTAQASDPNQQPHDEFQERSKNDPGPFQEPSTTEGIGRDRKGVEKDMEGTTSTPKRGRPRTPQTQVPDDFVVSPNLAETAFAEHGFDRTRLELEKKKFLNHHRAKGSKYSDWTHAFRNWLIKAKEFDTADSRNSPGRSQTPAYANTANALDFEEDL